MYHPGKVLDIFSSNDKNILSGDDSTQAMLDMWDGNLLTLMVHKEIANKIKIGDIVLVDYRPKEKLPVPNHIVVKILKGEKGKNVWDSYKKRLEKAKSMNKAQQSHGISSYMG